MALSIATRVTFITCYSFVFLLGLTMNLCTMIVIATSRHFRKSLSNILIWNLAVADFLICTIPAPYYIAGLAINQPESPGPKPLEIVCKGLILTTYTLGFTRILLLTAISMERYVAILHPYLYQKHLSALSPLQTIVICGYAWLQAFLTASPAVYMKGFVKYKGIVGKLCEFSWEDTNLSFIVPVFLINFAIPVTVIIYTNSRVYSTAKNQRKRIAATSRVCLQTDIEDENYTKTSLGKNYRNRKFGSSISRIGSSIPSFFKRPQDFQQGNCRFSVDLVSSNYPADRGLYDRKFSPVDANDRLKLDSMNGPIREAKHCERRSLSLPSSPKQGLVAYESNSCDENAVQGDCHEDGHNGNKSDITTEQQNGPVLVFRPPAIEHTGPDANNGDDGLPLAESRLDCTSERNGRKTSHLPQLPASDNSNETRKRSSQNSRKKQPRLIRNNDYVVFFSTLSVVILFMLTWLPYIITTILILVVGGIPVEVDMFAAAFTVVDSVVTPFIVFGTRREFRKQFLRKVWKRSSGPSFGM
eukprot:Seg219.4 transcript_id=Seg219.4/GoldUCD/mRNA.D3Y31 product="Pyrokinin-1 receptor" protein_id=Seg219.4/GoldUCD/D3Y31